MAGSTVSLRDGYQRLEHLTDILGRSLQDHADDGEDASPEHCWSAAETVGHDS